MKLRLISATIASAIGLSLLASCSAEPSPTVEKMPPSPPSTALGTASGKGTLELHIWSEDSAQPPTTEIIEFSPTVAYAYPANAGGQRTTWIVVADQALDTVALDAADNRQGWLKGACADKLLRFTALRIDSNGVPMESQLCAGDGQLSTARLSPDSPMGDRGSVKLDVNDGKHLKGSMAVGVGSSTLGEVESFAETTGEYQFDVDLSPPTLRDRVQAGGDEHASGLPGAKAAVLEYFTAAGKSKSLADIAAWLTPERRAVAEAKFAEAEKVAPTFAARMHEAFTKAHSKAPKITAAKAIGAAAVITFEMQGSGRTMNCETLLLQIEGAWKLGDENCKLPAQP